MGSRGTVGQGITKSKRNTSTTNHFPSAVRLKPVPSAENECDVLRSPMPVPDLPPSPVYSGVK